jgi:hypothetical protein
VQLETEKWTNLKDIILTLVTSLSRWLTLSASEAATLTAGEPRGTKCRCVGPHPHRRISCIECPGAGAALVAALGMAV